MLKENYSYVSTLKPGTAMGLVSALFDGMNYTGWVIIERQGRNLEIWNKFHIYWCKDDDFIFYTQKVVDYKSGLLKSPSYTFEEFLHLTELPSPPLLTKDEKKEFKELEKSFS